MAHTLTELGPGRTHVLFELAFEQIPAAERIAAPFVRAWLRRDNRRALDRLREQLETPDSRTQEVVAGAQCAADAAKRRGRTRRRRRRP